MITRKECEEALNNIICCDREDMGISYLSDAYRNDISILSKLIQEHFDNPPFKFEELEEGGTYYHVYYGWISIRSLIDNECILINTLNSDGYKQIEFEEDCFYRKQVE